jgi:general secretion pathway protein N
LVGTVAGNTVGIGIFIEPATQNIMRLRLGDDHQGWVLRSVKGRTATLEKDSETAVLELPPPASNAATIASAPAPPDKPPPRRPQRG